MGTTVREIVEGIGGGGAPLLPAFAAFEEKQRGTIEVGKWADFTVLDQDIMKIPEAEILKTKNVMTVIGGEVVYPR